MHIEKPMPDALWQPLVPALASAVIVQCCVAPFKTQASPALILEWVLMIHNAFAMEAGVCRHPSWRQAFFDALPF